MHSYLSSTAHPVEQAKSTHKMFSRLASFAMLALPILAVATPANVARNEPPPAPTPACCGSTIPVCTLSAI